MCHQINLFSLTYKPLISGEDPKFEWSIRLFLSLNNRDYKRAKSFKLRPKTVRKLIRSELIRVAIKDKFLLSRQISVWIKKEVLGL